MEKCIYCNKFPYQEHCHGTPECDCEDCPDPSKPVTQQQLSELREEIKELKRAFGYLFDAIEELRTNEGLIEKPIYTKESWDFLTQLLNEKDHE